jgi:hypothetical protein
VGPIERAARRAINPVSTRVTMLVQGRGLRRALGVRRGAAIPYGWAMWSGSAVAAHNATRPRLRIGRATARGQLAVPDVVGMTWADALEALARVGLAAVGADPVGPPLTAWPGFEGVVVDQRPKAGTVVRSGSAVALWIERGPGSAGVREPRRQHPTPPGASAMVDEETGESVG